MNEQIQDSLGERERNSLPPQPAGTGDSADGGLAPAPGTTNALATEDGQIGTLSEPDKVTNAVMPEWTKFADLTIDQKFEQARLIGFEVRDAYLRERCRVAKLEVAYAASALDRATAIIETNLPFFIIHFEEMDSQGQRSDLKGKVVGKTEWLRQNMPDISKGTFYAAFNAVKARYAEQQRLMLGGEVPPAPQPRTRTNHLTPIQSEVVTALVGQGFKNSDAILMVKAAEGQDFESLFKAALDRRAGKVIEFADHKKELDEEAESDKEEVDEAHVEPETSEPETEVTQTPPVPPTPTNSADELKAALANEPDRDKAGEMLTEHLRTYAEQFANERINIKEVTATVVFAGRDGRILPGDLLEKQNKTAPATLSKCVGVAEFMQRRRVQDWREGKWQKMRVVFSEHEPEYRVITDERAHLLAPEAFPASSPAKPSEEL